MRWQLLEVKPLQTVKTFFSPNDNATRHDASNNLDLRRRLKKKRALHKPCADLCGSQTMVNSRRPQQEWAYAQSKHVRRKLLALDVTEAMAFALSGTYDKICHYIFEGDGNSVVRQIELYAYLVSKPFGMSRDKRYRHMKLLERAGLVHRDEGLVHVHDYTRGNPSEEAHSIRKHRRQTQWRSAGARRRMQKRSYDKTSQGAQVPEITSPLQKDITPIPNRGELVTADEVMQIAANHPIFAKLIPSSVVSARISKKALDSAVAHLLSAPPTMLRCAEAALIDRAQRLTPWHTKRLRYKNDRSDRQASGTIFDKETAVRFEIHQRRDCGL